VTLLSRIITRNSGLEPPRSRVRVLKDLRVPVATDCDLLADVYLPHRRRPDTPVVLVRSPYGRRGKWGFAYGRLLSERGYIVVMQSTRGGYGSGGALEPMVHDAADGHATVAWMREQVWWTGRLVLAGASYQAWCGWALVAAEQPGELVGFISHVGPHQWRDVIRPGGSIAIETMLAWAADQLGPERPDGLLASVRRSRTAQSVDLGELLAPVPLRGTVDRLLNGAGPSWFHAWLDNPPSAPYWDAYDATAALDKLNVPTLIISGWDDLMVEQSWEQASRLDQRGVPVHLVIGPWTHRGLQSAWPEMISRTLRWLDDLTRDPPAASVAELCTTGVNEQWTTGEISPPTKTMTWCVSGAGLKEGLEVSEPVEASWRYDPLNPTPQVGGATMTSSAGRRDQSAVESRPDVVTFTSDSLAMPVIVRGAPFVVLQLKPVAQDVIVRLCDVDESGTSLGLCDAVVRLDAGATTASLPLPPIGHEFAPGHRLRLEVAGGAWPRWVRHLAPESGPDATQTGITIQTVTSSTSAPSMLALPVLE
jgi:putative CocE/NonD family hydrolase